MEVLAATSALAMLTGDGETPTVRAFFVRDTLSIRHARNLQSESIPHAVEVRRRIAGMADWNGGFRLGRALGTWRWAV